MGKCLLPFTGCLIKKRTGLPNGFDGLVGLSLLQLGLPSFERQMHWAETEETDDKNSWMCLFPWPILLRTGLCIHLSNKGRRTLAEPGSHRKLNYQRETIWENKQPDAHFGADLPTALVSLSLALVPLPSICISREQ